MIVIKTNVSDRIYEYTKMLVITKIPNIADEDRNIVLCNEINVNNSLALISLYNNEYIVVPCGLYDVIKFKIAKNN